MSMKKKGYLFMSVLAVLVLSYTSFIGNDGFLSEKKDNIECLKLKEKYDFLDCESLGVIGDEELKKIISTIDENSAPNITALDTTDYKEPSEDLPEEAGNNKSSNIENKVLLSIKSMQELSLEFAAPSQKAEIKEMIEEMNSQEFLIKMAKTK